jgi:hypothetical protein
MKPTDPNWATAVDAFRRKHCPSCRFFGVGSYVFYCGICHYGGESFWVDMETFGSVPKDCEHPLHPKNAENIADYVLEAL